MKVQAIRSELTIDDNAVHSKLGFEITMPVRKEMRSRGALKIVEDACLSVKVHITHLLVSTVCISISRTSEGTCEFDRGQNHTLM